MSCGGKQSFYQPAQALLNPGDEVIIPAPYWVSYPDMVLLADGEPVIIRAGVEHRLQDHPGAAGGGDHAQDAAVGHQQPVEPDRRGLQPGGTAALGEVLRKHPQVLIATDDMYEHILWTDEPFCNILNACPELYARTIVLNGVSKAYAMTGWRIGYAGGPAEMIKAMKKIQSQSTSNPASISQVAAQAALDGDQSCIQPMLKAFRGTPRLRGRGAEQNPRRGLPAGGRHLLLLPAYAGRHRPAGGHQRRCRLAEYLLDKAGVALVPGSAFGAPGYMRLSFATGMETLKGAQAPAKALTALTGHSYTAVRPA